MRPARAAPQLLAQERTVEVLAGLPQRSHEGDDLEAEGPRGLDGLHERRKRRAGGEPDHVAAPHRALQEPRPERPDRLHAGFGRDLQLLDAKPALETAPIRVPGALADEEVGVGGLGADHAGIVAHVCTM